MRPPPITLAAALQSAHCVVLIGCESYELGEWGRRRSHAHPARHRLGGRLTATRLASAAEGRSDHPGWTGPAGPSTYSLSVCSTTRPSIAHGRRRQVRERLTCPRFLGSVLVFRTGYLVNRLTVNIPNCVHCAGRLRHSAFPSMIFGKTSLNDNTKLGKLELH